MKSEKPSKPPTLYKLFYEKTDSLFIQMFRYLFVGGLSFLVDYGVLYLLTVNGLNYLISATVSFVLGLVVNFILSKIFVFKSQANVNSFFEFVTYGVIGLVGLFLTDLLMYIFTSLMGIYFMISKIIVTIIVLGWNFFGRKFILYRR